MSNIQCNAIFDECLGGEFMEYYVYLTTAIYLDFLFMVARSIADMIDFEVK